MIDVFVCVWVMRLCRLGKAVSNNATFQVIMFVSWLVLMFVLVVCVGTFGGGGGWEYSFNVSKHQRDSCISLYGRKEILFWISVGVGGVSWLYIKLYNFLIYRVMGLYCLGVL